MSFVQYSSIALHNFMNANFVDQVLFPVKEGFNKSFHKSCCKFC